MNRISSPGGISRNAQRGAVLFVALIFLILLTLLAVVGMNTSLLQERMTGGMRNAHLAQMGADSTVRAVEFRLWNAPANNENIECTFNSDTTYGVPCYVRGDTQYSGSNPVGALVNPKILRFRAARTYISPSIDGAHDAPTDYSSTSIPESARLAQRPRYLIEELGELQADMPHSGFKPLQSGPSGGVQPFKAFRITARSTGGTQSVVRMAESVFITQVQPAIVTP